VRHERGELAKTLGRHRVDDAHVEQAVVDQRFRE